MMYFSYLGDEFQEQLTSWFEATGKTLPVLSERVARLRELGAVLQQGIM
jgi:hypothetical protein